MSTILETDWKTLRSLKPRVLNEACSRILDDVQKILQNREGREHEAYLELWKLLREKDESIAAMFDDLRRSTAHCRLAAWRLHGVVSEDDWALFTEETREKVDNIADIMR